MEYLSHPERSIRSFPSPPDRTSDQSSPSNLHLRRHCSPRCHCRETLAIRTQSAEVYWQHKQNNLRSQQVRLSASKPCTHSHITNFWIPWLSSSSLAVHHNWAMCPKKVHLHLQSILSQIYRYNFFNSGVLSWQRYSGSSICGIHVDNNDTNNTMTQISRFSSRLCAAISNATQQWHLISIVVVMFRTLVLTWAVYPGKSSRLQDLDIFLVLHERWATTNLKIWNNSGSWLSRKKERCFSFLWQTSARWLSVKAECPLLPHDPVTWQFFAGPSSGLTLLGTG